jgi:sterol 24-C-methyltransferase
MFVCMYVDAGVFLQESFDGAYAIEATCHAPERRGVYGEIFKVLKPGAYFATYEWCLTDLYDKSNPKHRLMKKQVITACALNSEQYHSTP